MFIGFYNYTVILTYIGLLISVLGIFWASSGNPQYALICLMLSGLCDMFDGTIAATMERTDSEKNFGVQIDSLSDMICFGVLPAVIAFQMSSKAFIPTVIFCLYVLAGLIRLAYFNVLEDNRQKRNKDEAKMYVGLPITTIAMILPLAFCLNIKDLPYIYPLVLSLTSISFLLPFKFKKPGLKLNCAMLISGSVEFIFLLMRLA